MDMSNIEDDVELVKRYLENSAYKKSESNFFKNGGWEIVDLEIPKAMANILAEREQKDKRIQELEADLKSRTDNTNKLIEVTNLYLNSISRKAIIDKIVEVHNMKFRDDRLDSATIDFAVHKFEELLEGEE